jgi:acetylornithine deacetylase/succinyl-diaminopimelate desuccinylase-like protein
MSGESLVNVRALVSPAIRPLPVEPHASRPAARALAFAQEHRARFVSELAALVRIPSIGSDPARLADTRRCATWLAAHLRSIGLADARLLPTQGHPLVFGTSRSCPGRPVILIYGHYDVQPPGPLHAWHTRPFEAVIRAGWLHGRGASDDKGQLFAHLKAVESWLRTGGLPVNVKILLEGEEEVGSPSLAEALRANKPALAADVAVASDSPMPAPDRPVVTYALRGSLDVSVEVTAASTDLHSGIFGGAVPDPIQILCRLLATLRDNAGRVTVPGFYQAVGAPLLAERRALSASGPSDAQLLIDAHAAGGWGESGYSLFERTVLRPALVVTGIQGGHTGPGDRTAIAGRARARLNVRLVPDQDPDVEAQRLARFISSRVPSCARASVRIGRRTRPYRIEAAHPAVRAAARACARAFGTVPALLPSGGTIAAAPLLWEHLGIPTVLIGFALPGDGKHGPNERFHLPTFRRAIATSILFLEEAARVLRPGNAATRSDAILTRS